MDSTPNLSELTAEFIVAYYTTFTYDYRSTIKFYDLEKAQIYRQSLTENKSVKVSEAKNVIVPNLKGHEKLIIHNYTFNPISFNNGNLNGISYFNVVVMGKIVKCEKEMLFSQFSQFFTLEIINNERTAIISDSLTIAPQGNDTINTGEASEINESVSISPSEILFEIERRPTFLNKQNQQKSYQQQPQPQQQNIEDNKANPPKQTSSNNHKSKKSKNFNDSNRFVYTPGSE